MPNPFVPRAQVHAWSEDIGDVPDTHKSAITRLIKEQRRLSRMVEQNAESMTGPTGGIAVYLIGVILRMYDLAGGRMRNVTWDDIHAAEGRVGQLVDQLLPIDDGFVGRARQVERAQPHMLDEALYALFEREPKEGEPAVDPTEAFKIYLLMWIATEALDGNWSPPKGFDGPSEYTFTPVEDAA
ncbi:MAG: hypothetical protein R3F59_04540 [Myxococcota bacterium]